MAPSSLSAVADSAAEGGHPLIVMPLERSAEWIRRLQRICANEIVVAIKPSSSEIWIRGCPADTPILSALKSPSVGSIVCRAVRDGVWVEGEDDGTHGHVQTDPVQWILVRLNGTRERRPRPVGGLPLPVSAVELQPKVYSTTRIAVDAVLRRAPIDHDAVCLLTQNTLETLADLCRQESEQQIRRWVVAVSTGIAGPIALVRAQRGKGAIPVIADRGTSYQLARGVPQVLVPSGFDLRPTLNRAFWRDQLTVPPGSIGWLVPVSSDHIELHALAESAFRPLTDLIEYRVESHRDGIPQAESTAWRELREFQEIIDRPADRRQSSTAIDGTPQDESNRSNTSPELLQSTGGLVKRVFGWLRRSDRSRVPPSTPTAPADPPEISVDDAVRNALGPSDRLRHVRADRSSATAERVSTAEAWFRNAASEGKLDDVPNDRWLALAADLDQLARYDEAASCRLHAIWRNRELNPLEVWGWLRSECRAAGHEEEIIHPLDWPLAHPPVPIIRALAAWLVWQSVAPPKQQSSTTDLARIDQVLQNRHDDLPVRSLWSVQSALVRMGRGDSLGLARTRARLLERIRLRGLTIAQDAPAFIRSADQGTAERVTEARSWLVQKRELIHQWIVRACDVPNKNDDSAGSGSSWGDLRAEPAATIAVADLMIAWGLDRIAESAAADQIRSASVRALGDRGSVGRWLVDAFQYRMEQCREGRPPVGPLSSALLDRVRDLSADERFVVNRLRQVSRILEPVVQVEPYEEYLSAAQARPDAIESAELNRLLERWEEWCRSADFGILSAALNRCLEMSDVEAEPAMKRAIEILGGASAHSRPRSRLIERGLAAAAHHRSPEYARKFGEFFPGTVRTRSDWDVAEQTAGQLILSYRKLGMKYAADGILSAVASTVHEGRSPAKLRADFGREWPRVLRFLVTLTAGRLADSRADDSLKILDECRQHLFSTASTPRERGELAPAYAAALGFAPVRMALGRIDEMFTRLGNVPTAGRTSGHFALKPLVLVEAVVRSIVSDEFMLGTAVQSWLNHEELTITRRTREDLDRLMHQQGLVEIVRS